MVDHSNSFAVSCCEARQNPSRFRPAAQPMWLRSGFHGVQVQIFPPHDLIWYPAKGNQIHLAGIRDAGWLVLPDTGRHETKEQRAVLHPPLPSPPEKPIQSEVFYSPGPGTDGLNDLLMVFWRQCGCIYISTYISYYIYIYKHS